MALYEGLNRDREAPPYAPAARRVPLRPRPGGADGGWRGLNARVGPDPAPVSSGFIDAFLGAGSGASLKRAFGLERGDPPKRAVPPRDTRRAAEAERPVRPARLSVVGAGEDALPNPRGRKGLGRAVLIFLGMAVACAALKPWQRRGGLKADWGALLRAPQVQSPADAATAQAGQERAQSAKDAAALAALPLMPAPGRAVGLWRDSSGRWWRVDAAGDLAPCADPQGVENLGLPELRGVAAHAEPFGGGRRESLDLPPGRLAQMLPLETSVAAEVSVVDLSRPDEPVLLTLDGTRCLMGGDDWDREEGRLALVLADLAARHRRAAQVDLRFQGTAVVRPI